MGASSNFASLRSLSDHERRKRKETKERKRKPETDRGRGDINCEYSTERERGESEVFLSTDGFLSSFLFLVIRSRSIPTSVTVRCVIGIIDVDGGAPREGRNVRSVPLSAEERSPRA